MANKDSSSNTKEEKALAEQTTSIAHTQPIGAPDEPIRRFIRAIAEGERIDTEKWLSTLDKLYDGWKYSSSQRIAYTVPILNEEQKHGMNKIKVKLKTIGHFFVNDSNRIHPTSNQYEQLLHRLILQH